MEANRTKMGTCHQSEPEAIASVGLKGGPNLGIDTIYLAYSFEGAEVQAAKKLSSQHCIHTTSFNRASSAFKIVLAASW